jgi:dihydroflavonol-4-reductase
MRYLVTGATGLVGNNITRALLDRGEQVRVLARRTSNPRPLEGLAVEVVTGDITDAAAVAEACRGVDVIFNAAGAVHIGWHGEAEMQRVNVDGARQVAIAARHEGAKLLHISTANAIGVGLKGQPADETNARPQSLPIPYVITKQGGEKAVLDEVARGLDAVILNPGFMLGPWDWKPTSGRMLLQVLQLRPIGAPWGGNSLCDVRDVTQAMLTAVNKGRRGERYILAGHNLTFLETWRLFAKVCGGSAPRFRFGPINRFLGRLIADGQTWLLGREGDFNSASIRMSSQYHYFSSEKARRELGYQTRAAEESIRDAWNWLVEYGYASANATVSPKLTSEISSGGDKVGNR